MPNKYSIAHDRRWQELKIFTKSIVALAATICTDQGDQDHIAETVHYLIDNPDTADIRIPRFLDNDTCDRAWKAIMACDEKDVSTKILYDRKKVILSFREMYTRLLNLSDEEQKRTLMFYTLALAQEHASWEGFEILRGPDFSQHNEM